MGGVGFGLLERIDAETGGRLGAALRAQMNGQQHGAGDLSFNICVEAAQRQLAAAKLRKPPPNTTLASSVPVQGQRISPVAMETLGGNEAVIGFACNYPGNKQTPKDWLAEPGKAHPTVKLFLRPMALANMVVGAAMETTGLGDSRAAEMQHAGARRAELLPIGAIVNPTMPLLHGRMFDLTSAAHVGANEDNRVRPPSPSRCGPSGPTLGRAVLCLHPLRVWRAHSAACGPPRRIACAQIPHDYKPESERLFRELVANGDTSVELSFAPKQFVQLNELADKLLREGVLSHVERVTTDGATAIAGEVLGCVLPELRDQLTLVGPSGGDTGMLLLERASDGHIVLWINLGHFTNPTFTFRLTEADRHEALRAFDLRTVVIAATLLDLRFEKLPMDRQPFAAVVEKFFGHSLEPTREPHTVDTLRKILGQFIVENGKEHRSHTAAVCAAKGDPEELAKLAAKMGDKEYKAAASSAGGIEKLGKKHHDSAVNVTGRLLVELVGPTKKPLMFAAKFEEILPFVELRRSHVVDLTGCAVWKEPKPAEPPTEGNSRCAKCGQEYRKGQSRHHKKNCGRKVDVVWADRDCASEYRVRIRLSGSVVRTPLGVDWTPSLQHSEIMAKNGIKVLSVRQNADGNDI